MGLSVTVEDSWGSDKVMKLLFVDVESSDAFRCDLVNEEAFAGVRFPSTRRIAFATGTFPKRLTCLSLWAQHRHCLTPSFHSHCAGIRHRRALYGDECRSRPAHL